MADDRPENKNGAGGPDRSRDGNPREGQGRRGGRHRGMRGRHGGREGAAQPSAPEGRQPEASRDREAGRDAGRRPAGEDLRQNSRADDSSRQDASRQEAARDMPACPLCGKPVYDLSTAIAASREQAEPAHFDCVLERVTASETLAAGEKLVYLGSGSFGVVTFKDKNESAFTVLRRVQWEKEGEKKDWRKGLSSRIQNL